MQQCRFAGARRTDERDDLACPQVEIDAVEHFELGSGQPEDPAHVLQFERRTAHKAPLRPSGGRGRGPVAEATGRVRWAAPRPASDTLLTPTLSPASGERG